jgi:hypothetical protein
LALLLKLLNVDGGTFKEMKMRKLSDDEIEEKESKKYEKGLIFRKKNYKFKIIRNIAGIYSGNSGKSGNRSGNRSGDSGSSGKYTNKMKCCMKN